MPSKALPRVSGPVHIYVSFAYPTLASLNTIPNNVLYLGTCEVTPEYSERLYYKKLQNEMACESLPLDETKEGYDFLITLVLTSYNESVRQTILKHVTDSDTLGIEDVSDRGKTVYGSNTVQLILQNQFYNTSNSQPDDLPGYIFYYAKLAASTPVQGGTTENKLGMIFECASGLLYPSFGNFKKFSNGKFLCYGNPSSISSLIPKDS